MILPRQSDVTGPKTKPKGLDFGEMPLTLYKRKMEENHRTATEIFLAWRNMDQPSLCPNHEIGNSQEKDDTEDENLRSLRAGCGRERRVIFEEAYFPEWRIAEAIRIEGIDAVVFCGDRTCRWFSMGVLWDVLWADQKRRRVQSSQRLASPSNWEASHTSAFRSASRNG